MAENNERITEQDIKRIDELNKIDESEEGLSDDERRELTKLRYKYLDAVKRNMK
ncbi:MAG: DUF896 domain-containing protein [Eubacteriales bacterium]|nr:DUF896 domain-containing protein [Eubacteriales bacterium]